MVSCSLLPLLLSLPAAAGPSVEVVDGARCLVVDGRRVLTLNTPWVATADWQSVYSFPVTGPSEAGGDAVVRTHEGDRGRMVETIAAAGDTVKLRYEFAFSEIPAARHIQWYWRLEPGDFNAAQIEGQGARDVAIRSIAGASVGGLKRLVIMLSDLDLDVSVSASTGEWSFADQREAAWARCYRLDYNRDFTVDGKREGWFEVSIKATHPEPATAPCSSGEELMVRGVPFAIGPPKAVDRPLAGLLLLHMATGEAARGEVVGEVILHQADGGEMRVPLAWQTALTSATDDPRDLPAGRVVALPDGTLAWITPWRNPSPDVAIGSIEAVSHAAGWRLLGATGVRADADERRIAMALRAGSGSEPLTEEIVVPLDGTWRFQPEGGEERDIPVPARWETIDGLRDVHRGTYRRTFDVPDALQGQRILLRFDTVGDYCEVAVNGHHVGEHLGPCVPFEMDVTERARPGSTGNTLEVDVKDDTHFSVPKEKADWRDRRHWVPRGMGGNSRKGIWQSAHLVGRPPVQISNVRVQTSVRERKLTVVYELFNCRRATFKGELTADVRPWQGGDIALQLPATPVELPGYVTTAVTVEAAWQDPILWQPDEPTLYSLRSILTDADGKRAHRADTRFGFREVWFEGIHFHLNGIRFNLRGESPSYSGSSELMDTPEAAEGMVRRALAAGFNVLRFHAVPAPQHVYDVCDEMGMLVIDESGIYASWQMLMPEHPRWMPECVRHLAAWVRRDRNHPSVVLWSAENEGLNVSVLTPGQLAEYKRVIDANDGTRPVIFCGDGTGCGVSEASSKHYVRQISDLEDRGGVSSGYGRDLRYDIYWAAEYEQDIPLGISEFLFPANDAMRERHREVCAMMGLQTRGYRYADWFDIRPYNPFYTGYQNKDGLKEGYEDVWNLIVKSFAAIAVFDKDYDALGPFPEPPKLKVGEPARRTLIAYNDALSGTEVTVSWEVTRDGQRIAGDEKQLAIELGYHTEFQIDFTPDAAGTLELHLASAKAGVEQFRDARTFVAE